MGDMLMRGREGMVWENNDGKKGLLKRKINKLVGIGEYTIFDNDL